MYARVMPLRRSHGWCVPSPVKAVGAAMKMDERVPKITPRIMAKEKLRMLSPPRMKIHSSTISVVTEVLMVRAMSGSKNR